MISVIVPTYNRASVLARAIDSVLRQTYADWEIIVVDDGSTDQTAEVLKGYRDPRIRMVRHEVNRGVTCTKNTGLNEIRGEWFVILDDDDEIVPEALEVLARTAEETGAGAITCNCADSRSGEMTGHGWESDGWKRPGETAALSGEHWGMTRTSLLGELRFNERLPGQLGTVWSKITIRAGGRYYLHKALRIYHKEGSDRVTLRARGRTLAERVRIALVLAEDAEYLDTMKSLDPVRYTALHQRILRARILDASGLLKLPVFRSLRPRTFRILASVSAIMSLMAMALVVGTSRRLRSGDRTASTL